MAKGNRTINLYKDDVWKSVFFESVGTYVNVINNELSQEYPLEPLSDYIKIGGGYAFKTSEYKKSGIPIIRISDFNNEQIDISNCIYYDEDPSLLKYELNENDIIICLTGGTIAKLGIVQSGLGKLYMNQRVGRFDILDGSKFEKEYVYWIARSVQSIIKNLAWGAAIPNVSPKQIEKLQFSFPPINVQQQIIEFLNDLKNNAIQRKVYFNENIERHIIELQNNNVALKDVNSELTHQLNLIKQLRQAFLREAMQGKLVKSTNTKETGHELLAKIKAEKAQLIAEKKLKKEKELAPISEDEIPFEIPAHWAWCRLGEISNIKRGKSPKYSESGVLKMLNQKCVRWFSINTEHSKAVDEFWFNSIDKELKIKVNDLLVNSTGDGTIGRSGIADIKCDNFMFDSHILRVRSFVKIEQKLLCYIINSVYGQSLIESIKGATSTKQTELGVNNLSNFPIPLPPLHEQEQIVAKLEELMEFCDGLEQSIKESQGYNEQLLQQVLREALQSI
jgi:restriction endonuclease S subunit